MQVSWNGGSPTSSISIGFSRSFHSLSIFDHFGKAPVCRKPPFPQTSSFDLAWIAHFDAETVSSNPQARCEGANPRTLWWLQLQFHQKQLMSSQVVCLPRHDGLSSSSRWKKCHRGRCVGSDMRYPTSILTDPLSFWQLEILFRIIYGC